MPHQRNQRPLELYVLMVGFFALGVNVYIVSPILPQMARDLQRPVAEVGLLVSAYSLPYAVLGPFFGPMSDRLGRKTVTFTWFMASSGIFTYLGEFFAQSFSMRTEQIALVLGAYGLMGIVGTRLGGRFSDSLGKKRSVMLGITAFGLAALSLQAVSQSLLLALGMLGVWAIGIWFGLPSQQAILSELAPAVRGTVMAVNNSMLYLGSAVGPAVAGQVYTQGGFLALSLYTGVVAAIALGLATLVLREEAHDDISDLVTE